MVGILKIGLKLIVHLKNMEFLDPKKIIEKLDLKSGMTVADFGCGRGDWAIPLAKKIFPGKVIAIDILEEPLSALRSQMKIEKIFNIEPRCWDLEEKVFLRDNSVDLVVIANLLFQVENKVKVLEEAKRILRDNGKILIVDWKKDNPLTQEIEFCNIDEIKEILKKLNLKVIEEFDIPAYHWGLIAKK
jgi:ubiquinone/menaquinone biosynthesis C-methylase UbiE